MQHIRPLLVALFSALIIVGSYLRFPLPPVPITLQTLFLLLAGFLGGSTVAVSSVAIFLLLGLIGLPVYSGGGGIGYLLGPTGGFLIGMLPAALLAGLGGNFASKSERMRTYTLLCTLAGVLAMLCLYSFGVTWLKLSRSLSWGVAFKAAVLPFLIGDVIKLIVALQLGRTFAPRIEELTDSLA
jgi:biotin transport system substrate-specific component